MNADDQKSPNQPKSRSGPEFLGLSRCAACYNHKANSKHWRGGDGESSSSAEDSGPEADVESDAESSSSSSCSGTSSSETPEEPEPEKKPSAGSGGEDGDRGGEEAVETSESREDKIRRMRGTQRAPLVKSSSLPSSFSPQLIPLSRLRRPNTVVSTLRLQVISQSHDSFCIFKQHLSERGEERVGGGRGGDVNLLPLQQHQLSYQYQQPHLQHLPPLPAEGQRLPLPALLPPTLQPPPQAPNAPQTHVHAVSRPCWYCHSMQLPYSPYWSH